MVNFKLKGLICNIYFIYLDDLIVIGATTEEHLKNLRTVFNRIRETKLVLQPDKYKYMEKELEYLGHSVGPEGVKPLKKNVDKVLNYSQPKNVKELERFMGLASYYRKFVENFAKIAAPLNRLKAKNTAYEWTPQCEKAFKELKTKLTSYPVLKHPDTSGEFIINTDASNEGLGVIMSQLDDQGKEHPVSYSSRGLGKSEKNYSATKKELSAITWGIKQYKLFLYGQKFKVYIDHQPIKGLLTARHDNMSSRLFRLTQKLTDYHPKVIYKKGKLNTNADALSRAFPINEEVLDNIDGILANQDSPSLEEQEMMEELERTLSGENKHENTQAIETEDNNLIITKKKLDLHNKIQHQAIPETYLKNTTKPDL